LSPEYSIAQIAALGTSTPRQVAIGSQITATISQFQCVRIPDRLGFSGFDGHFQ
jgi:hypothetical protein